MNDTQGNGTNSSIPFISSEIDTYLALGTTINSIYIILGLPINSYVVWLILSGAGGTIASEFFYLNLTVSMIISSLASVFALAWQLTRNLICHHIYVLAFNIFFFVSVPSFQCCICVERYIAVVHPVVFLRYKALRYRVACCCVVWLMSLAFSSFYFWSTTVVCYISLGFDIVCISVMSFCCFSVLRALKQPGPGEGQRDRGEGNDMKRRAFKIILISLIVMLLTAMSHITNVVTHLTNSTQVATFITFTIAMVSGFVHPLLYIYKAGKLPCFRGF